MKEYLKKYAVAYICCFAFCGIMAGFYLNMHEFDTAETVDRYRLLCDAFSLPGMLLILFGGLMWVSAKGTLDALGFIGKKLVSSLIPGGRLDREERYADYVQRQREKRKGGYGFLFVAGAISIAVSLVFLALFYSVN